mmetsp:Transcript_111765/g.348323  ORF Transcript_111765/g.348323 Transcript_111765/m.348323 type:complete len:206 (+) Transcript_111765:1404-2021(+)
MVGRRQPREAAAVPGYQALGLICALLPLALLHGQDDAEAPGALGLAEGLERLVQHRLLLLVVREDDQVHDAVSSVGRGTRGKGRLGRHGARRSLVPARSLAARRPGLRRLLLLLLPLLLLAPLHLERHPPGADDGKQRRGDQVQPQGRVEDGANQQQQLRELEDGDDADDQVREEQEEGDGPGNGRRHPSLVHVGSVGRVQVSSL